MAISTPSGRKLTYEDYAAIPEGGRRHEIIDGKHIVNPASTPEHQAISTRLLVALFRIEKEGRVRVFHAPIDVHLSEYDVVQPDLVAVATVHGERVGSKKVTGPPDLVIEILSPSTSPRSGPRTEQVAVEATSSWEGL